MRRFPDGALWSERLAVGTLTPSQVDSFADRLAALHREASVAPPDSPFGSPAVYPALFIPCESDRHARVGTCPVVVRLRVQLS